MRRLIDIARKDVTVLVRDKSAFLVLIAMPMILIFILGTALGNTETADFRIKVHVVDLDGGTFGASLADGLIGSKELDGLFDIKESDDLAETRSAVERGDIAAALVIPAGATGELATGDVTLEVLKDPGSDLGAGLWASVVRATAGYGSAQMVVSRAAMGAGIPPTTVDLDAVQVAEAHFEAEPSASMMQYYSAAMSAMFLLFGSMFGAFSFVIERREGTLQRVLSAPVRVSTVVFGKGLSTMLVGVSQFTLLMVGTRLLFGTDWGTRPLLSFALGVVAAFAATGFAMLLAGLGRSERAIGGIAPALIILMSVTGGAMFPMDMLPTWLKPVQMISPIYWALDGWLTLMEGGTPGALTSNFIVLLVLGFVMYAFGIWRLQRS